MITFLQPKASGLLHQSRRWDTPFWHAGKTESLLLLCLPCPILVLQSIPNALSCGCSSESRKGWKQMFLHITSVSCLLWCDGFLHPFWNCLSTQCQFILFPSFHAQVGCTVPPRTASPRTAPFTQSVRLKCREQDEAKEGIIPVVSKWLLAATGGSSLGSDFLLTVQEQLDLPRFPASSQDILTWPRQVIRGWPHIYYLKCKWCMTRTELRFFFVFYNVQWVVSRQLISIPILLLFRKGRQHIPQEQKSIFSCHLNTNNKEIPVP